MASSSSSSKSLATLMLVTALVAILMVGETSAQVVPSCASNLIACAEYLNSTKPPETCCKPLRETVATQRVCLCNLFNDPNLLSSLGINITQALALPQYCGVSADTGLCTAPPPITPTSTTPSTPPPGVAGGDDANSAGKMAWSGGSGLLLLWVSLMAY